MFFCLICVPVRLRLQQSDAATRPVCVRATLHRHQGAAGVRLRRLRCRAASQASRKRVSEVGLHDRWTDPCRGKSASLGLRKQVKMFFCGKKYCLSCILGPFTIFRFQCFPNFDFSRSFAVMQSQPQLALTYLGSRQGEDEGQVRNSEAGTMKGEHFYLALCQKLSGKDASLQR